MNIQRGNVVLVNLGNQTGSIQSGSRPAVVVQNDIGNIHSPTVIVAPLTSNTSKTSLPTHVYLAAGDGGVLRDSLVLTEQIRTIDKDQIGRVIGMVSTRAMETIDGAIKISLGL